MLVLRFLLILTLVAVAVTFAIYLLSGDKRYLRLCWQIVKFTLVLLLVAGAVFAVGRIILFESTLSFLGFGIVPPTPTWGNMLTNAQQLIISAPALAVFPGLLIFLTVMSVNFVGDGIRIAFDPRSKS